MGKLIGILIVSLTLMGSSLVISTDSNFINKMEMDTANASDNSDSKVFEMRTYITHEGRLDALQNRFSNHTMRLFEKHGMTNIGYWVPTDPETSQNTLIYIISHESMEAAKKSWDSFRADPEWQKVVEESQVDGAIIKEIISVYLKSTPYSQIK